mmetsp:Transcript_93391/g.171379  ORF Transcript_93391/g.171379 Transcript_93391/m.171379 type:complete len:82 (-) Transcript_93391:8-253(-)
MRRGPAEVLQREARNQQDMSDIRRLRGERYQKNVAEGVDADRRRASMTGGKYDPQDQSAHADKVEISTASAPEAACCSWCG